MNEFEGMVFKEDIPSIGIVISIRNCLKYMLFTLNLLLNLIMEFLDGIFYHGI